MWWSRKPVEPVVRADKPVPAHRTWWVVWAENNRLVEAHEVNYLSDGSAMFTEYTGGRWVDDYCDYFPNVGPYWRWNRRDVLQVRGYQTIEEVRDEG